MKRITLRTSLLTIAVLAAWLAGIKQFAYKKQVDRTISLIRVDGVSPNPVAAGIANRAAIARALADPAIACLPSVRDLADPAAEVDRHLTAVVRPGTRLIEVAMNWTAGPDAPAIVNKVVDNALDAAPPGQLRRVNLAVASGAPSRRTVAPVPAALMTLAAAAFLLVLVGPHLLRKAKPHIPTDGSDSQVATIAPSIPG